MSGKFEAYYILIFQESKIIFAIKEESGFSSDFPIMKILLRTLSKDKLIRSLEEIRIKDGHPFALLSCGKHFLTNIREGEFILPRVAFVRRNISCLPELIIEDEEPAISMMLIEPVCAFPFAGWDSSTPLFPTFRNRWVKWRASLSSVNVANLHVCTAHIVLDYRKFPLILATGESIPVSSKVTSSTRLKPKSERKVKVYRRKVFKVCGKPNAILFNASHS